MEEIKKLYLKWIEVCDQNTWSHDLATIKKQEKKESRYYNKFAKACELQGLNHVKVAADLCVNSVTF